MHETRVWNSAGDGADGWFASTKTTVEAVKHNIKNLLLTQKGERYFQPNLGINLRLIIATAYKKPTIRG